MAEPKNERRSAVAPLADRRGGPSNFSGTGYQVDVGVCLFLGWVNDARYNPAAVGVVRCEPRTLVGDGQVGFDLGRSTRDIDEFFEVKSRPKKDEVLTFIAQAAILAEETARTGRRATFTLVSGTEVAPFADLRRLWAHHREGSSAAELVALVEQTGSEQEKELLRACGDDPVAVLNVIGEPMLLSEQPLEQTATFAAKSMSEPGRADDLRAHLGVYISDGNRTRLSKPLTEIAAELAEAGILSPPHQVDVTGADPRLVSALSVLQDCPVPLPETVLAAGTQVTVDELAALLSEHLAGGGVTFDDGTYYTAAPASMRLPSNDNANARTLSALNAEAEQAKETYAYQASNALALASRCARSHPDAVAHVFVAFDKAVKAWGDLQLTYRLAQLATDAIQAQLDAGAAGRALESLARDKVHTKICGQSWVLQRVDELDDAHMHLIEANRLTGDFHDPANHAFGLKCEGRMLRLLAEAAPLDDPARGGLLEDSHQMLTDAHTAFTALLEESSRFAEDHAECVSLRARTLVTALRFDDADAEIVQAQRLLDSRPDSKAYADLLILKGDLWLARLALGTVDADSDQDAAQERLVLAEALIRRHDQIVEALFNPGSSEIAARARVLAGRLHQALGDLDAAARYYGQAAELYGHLRYPGARDEALWNATVISEEVIPDGLRQALDGVGASASVRLIALDDWRRQSTSAPSEGDAGILPDAENPIWSGLVRAASKADHARHARWGEGRSA